MSQFDSIVKSHPIVVVDFYADWCQPCKIMAPELKKLKDELGEKVKVVKIDTEKNQKLSAKFNIRSIPTLQVYHYGKLKKQQAGALMHPQLKQLVSEFL